MAVLRRSSSEEDIDQDEDALLKSKWSLAMFPELSHSDDQELLLLEKWLQVELRPPFWIVCPGRLEHYAWCSVPQVAVRTCDSNK